VQQHADYLELVCRILEQLRQICARYTALAASVDQNYQRNSPLSRQFDASRLKKTLVIDNVSTAAEPPQPSISSQDEKAADDKHGQSAAASGAGEGRHSP
jgi:hypothetical protein